jgi:predicted nucleotidyltransferase
MRRHSLDEPALLGAVLAVPGHVDVAAVLLCGSYARGEADAASDVNVVCLVRGDRAYMRIGQWQAGPVEVVYTPVAHALEAPARRATLAGARILYDPDGVAGPWLRRLAGRFGQPYRMDAAEAMHDPWDLGRRLLALETAAATGDTANIAYLRGIWLGDLVAYLLARRGRWAPARRRQLAALRQCDEYAYQEVAACLDAGGGTAAVAACRRALEDLVGEATGAPLAEASLFPLEP